MQTTTNESGSQKANPILQLKRPLLSVDEYAEQQGLSKHTVEQYIRSGAIQVRKCRGKTYVVDVPVSPYHDTPEELDLIEDDPEITAQAAEQPPQPPDAPHLETVSRQVPRIGTVSPRIQSPDSDPTRLSFLDPATWTKRMRKIVAVASTACVLAIIMAGFWLYINQAHQGGRLDKAFATIRTVNDNSIQTSRQLAAIQTNLVESTADIQSVRTGFSKIAAEVTALQNELRRISKTLEAAADEPPGSTPEVTEFRNLLNNTRAEVQTLRSEIAQATEDLETTKRENTRALGLLRGQVQQLTALLNELAGNSETPAEPDTADE